MSNYMPIKWTNWKKCIEKYNLCKLSHKEIENMNRPISNMEIETVIKGIPTNKNPEADGFTGEFY